MTTNLMDKLADKRAELWAQHTITIRLRGKMLGGVPRDPKILDAWIRKNTGLADDEAQKVMVRTLQEMGVDATEGMTWDELDAATEKVIADTKTVGFKRDDDGLYIESRQVKAMIKESVNVLFAGDRWGKTKKGPKSFTAERVFVTPDRVRLGREEPDGIEQMIVHVTGPKGPMSSINRSEYVEGAQITFTVLSLRDELAEDHWAEIWAHAEENGIGAARSQGFGQFDVVSWERVPLTKASKATIAKVDLETAA